MFKLSKDKVGLGWRAEIAPAILSHLDQIDVVEVIIDDYLNKPLTALRPLKLLQSHIQVIYHGIGLGLASSLPVCQRKLTSVSHCLNYLSPVIWSEHLAFVRAGKIELGHLAAPPYTKHTLEGLLKNLKHVKECVGCLPLLENVATLFLPPGSTMTEPVWISEIIKQTGCYLLLDLNNLYTNAINFNLDPFDYLYQFPLEMVKLVHLSGGTWIDEPVPFKTLAGKRMLDDHFHDIPDIVFDLLKHLARKVAWPLMVIIERDGAYPSFDILLKQISRTRAILCDAKQIRNNSVLV
ncbi:MAG: DUF692 family protein [Proteobacteria bacterium]|nr:DUF692 family protein [Pseudomonadota bacterium]